MNHFLFSSFFRAALFLMLITSQSARAESLADVLTSKTSWSNFDWDSAETSRIWQDADFVTYKSPSSSSADDQYEKNQKVTIAGKTYNVSLVRIPLQLSQPNYLVVATSLESSTCDQLVSEWSRRFGRTDISMDNSYKPLDGYTLGEILNVWRLAKTTAIAECTTIGPTLPGTFSISFRPAAHPVPDAPVHLNCTRNFITSGANPETRRSPPTAISIIPARGVVTDAGGVMMIANVKTTFSAFEWTIVTDTLIQKIRIDRSNGALSGSANLKSNNQLLGTYEGSCEKRVPGERRF
jgi:hypothetical protein